MLGGALPKYTKGLLEGIVCGSLATPVRLQRAGERETEICDCGEAPGTQEHLWFDCKRLRGERTGFPIPELWEERVWGGPAWRACGIQELDQGILDERQKLYDLRGRDQGPHRPLDAPRDHRLLVKGERVQLWTDGACSRQSDPHFRRAGWGS